ncbi:unnamed protein product [Tenebrio molitor]|nr:unnamed protein product [Tenebrio molitor]
MDKKKETENLNKIPHEKAVSRVKSDKVYPQLEDVINFTS